MTPKKILIFSRAYQNMAGGVEKMSLDLARGLSERGHSVAVMSLDNHLDQPFFEWPHSIQWIKIGIGDPSKRASFVARCQRLKSIRAAAKENRPDVGIGFQVGSFALLRFATLGLGIKTIAAERNSPDLFGYIRNGKIKRFFSNIILLTSYRVAVQFENYRLKYPIWLRTKIVVTPNWVKEVVLSKSQDPKLRFSILFVGRLTFQKNVNVLLSAMSLLPDNFQLTIIGDGPELEDLKARAELLPHLIEFEPPMLDLSSAYQNASVLCMPSRWEGFPNVVAEALSYGLPVVGYRLCSGIPELIEEGFSGIIAEGMNNPSTLADALLKASRTDFPNLRISKAMKKYSFRNFINHWEESLT